MWEQILGTPEYIRIARKCGRRHPLWRCILLTLAVFGVGSVINTAVAFVPMMAELFSSETLHELAREMATGNLTLTEYFDGIMKVTAEITTAPSVMLAMLFGTGGTVAACLIYWRKIDRSSFDALGLERRGSAVEYIVGAVIGVAMLSAAVGLATAFGGMTFEGLAVAGPSDALFLVLFFLGYLVQGFSEELLCRGVLTASIGRTRSPFFAMLISAAFFAVLHLANPGITPLAIPNIFLFGLVASLYAYRRGNIWGISAVHSLWNFAQGNLFGVSVSGTGSSVSLFRFASVADKTWINGGSFGLEGGIAVTLVLALAFGVLLAVKPKTYDETRVF